MPLSRRDFLRVAPAASLFGFGSSRAVVPNPNDELAMQRNVREGFADARKLPASVAKHTRYLTLYAVPESDRADFVKYLTFWIWSIAGSAEPTKPRRVSEDLVAVNLQELGIDPYVYGRLAAADPYLHLALTPDGKRVVERGLYTTALVKAGVGDLARLLGGGDCRTSILRADWFVWQTSVNDGRGDTGYYSMVFGGKGVKSRADFQQQVGLSEKLAEERGKEWKDIVKRSGIARYPRQIGRYGALDGGYWFTLDVIDYPEGERDAQGNFGKAYKHQAEEHYGLAPSGLFAFLLCDAEGKLQDAAPDKVGHDSTRPGKDKRLEVGLSCVRCHTEGIRPVDSWVKNTFRGKVLAEVDAKQAEEVRRVYFRNLAGKLAADNRAYAERLLECNGLTPKENAALFIKMWDRFGEEELSVDDCARELGCTPARWKNALKAVGSQGKLDPLFADLVSEPPGTIRRESWQSKFQAALLYLGY